MVDETLKCIGAKLGVSAAEIALAWLLEQASVVAMPKAQRIESQRANLAALNLNRDGADRAEVSSLPKNRLQKNITWKCSHLAAFGGSFTPRHGEATRAYTCRLLPDGSGACWISSRSNIEATWARTAAISRVGLG